MTADPPQLVLRHAAAQYLALRRRLGFKLVTQGKLLWSFIAHTETEGAAHITADSAVAWAYATSSTDPSYVAARLSVVRGFACHLAAFDPATQIPPARLPAGRSGPRRSAPFVYSPGQIGQLMRVARTRPTAWHRRVLPVIIGLMAATGMRISEVISLDCGDVDLDGRVLIVTGKNNRLRDVVMHPTTAVALRGYRTDRDARFPRPADPAFFLNDRGRRVTRAAVECEFRTLVRLTGIHTDPTRRAPRLHDLRHTMSVTTLIDWYRAGIDIDASLPRLSAYLGHVSPKSTYWYLQATPELLALAAGRLCQFGNEHP
jgi:integrase